MPHRKIWDIDHPPVALLVGTDARTSDLATAVEGSVELQIERVADRSAALDRLAERPVVDCCWIAADSPTELWLEFLESVANEAPLTRIVYAPEAGDIDLADRATALGAADVVAPATTIDERATRLVDAVDQAVDRRHDAVERSILDSIVDGLDVSVFAKDDKARHLVYPSDTTTGEGRELFGLTDLEAFGTNDETLSDAYQDDLAVIREGRNVLGKVERYPDFQQGWQWTSKVPWIEDGETRGLVGLTMEISEWKNRERALLQQVGYLQRIPKYLTHDLRNPLAIARGYVQLAREGEPGALDTVEEALDRMSDKLTEFHGLVDGSASSEQARSPVPFARTVEEVWDHVSLPGTELILEADPDARLLADEDQLRPLLQNLFRNAIDHAGPRVTVRVTLTRDGFVVGDDGPGLGDWSDEDVFATGTTSASNAAGLGLAIVREVAHLHGWQVETGRSDLGGASFTFSGCLLGRLSGADVGDERFELEDSRDVGDVSVAGSTRTDGDVATLRGAGANVWGKVNEFHFAHATVTDDVRIEARVTEMDVASEHSKAGVMIRSGLDEDAAYGAICRIADQCPEVLWRDAPGERGYSVQAEGVEQSFDWIAIDRVGDECYTSISVDGDVWIPIDDRSLDLSSEVAVGLFACSAAEGEAIEARFEDLSIRRLE
ncbi:PAS/PAC sensor signal transduction histidine kinase [Salinarchaeum sp. Harcht-Bsk1]|uniref:ATP-binding protein n=1 Tax=Salinarchaeum sp. Harcht-Bsk1 TaxID=1333523 RepID=UPI000342303D|nr:ATP-binding protein [Salinarchaeum sp. Harcht-Bsk1]AGN00259.1 PAS/PAC sensor signal transduction histidine kinase [Salinarchaeum sp. Harcht-Bsk1]